MRLPGEFLARPVAHRALHGPGRPENSRAAIRAAVDAGWGIEIDVQPAADGTPMVFHDYALDRLTGREGWVRLTPRATLQSTLLTGGEDGIPTLDEALEIIAGRVPLFVEIKDQDGSLGPSVGALERAVADILRRYDGPVAVMGFNPNSVRVFGGFAPDIPRGLVTDAFTADDWPMVPLARREKLAAMRDLDACGASFVSHNHRYLDTPVVAALNARSMPVLTWTIRSAGEAARALHFADQITFEGYTPD